MISTLNFHRYLQCKIATFMTSWLRILSSNLAAKSWDILWTRCIMRLCSVHPSVHQIDAKTGEEVKMEKVRWDVVHGCGCRGQRHSPGGTTVWLCNAFGVSGWRGLKVGDDVVEGLVRVWGKRALFGRARGYLLVTWMQRMCTDALLVKLFVTRSTWRHRHQHQQQQQDTWSDQWTRSWSGHVVSAGRWHSTIPRCTTLRSRSDLAPSGSDFRTATSCATSTKQNGCAPPISSNIPITSIGRDGNRNRFLAMGMGITRRHRLRWCAAHRGSKHVLRSQSYRHRRSTTSARLRRKTPSTAARWEQLHGQRPPTSERPPAYFRTFLEQQSLKHHCCLIQSICLPCFRSIYSSRCWKTAAEHTGMRWKERTTGRSTPSPTCIIACCSCVFCSSLTVLTTSRSVLCLSN